MSASLRRPLLASGGVRSVARARPTAVALIQGDRTITYGQLVERMNRLGNAVKQGWTLRRGDRVAVFASNRIEYMELVLGLSDAGMVPVLVSARAAAPELMRILDDAAPRALIGDESHIAMARDLGRDLGDLSLLSLGAEYETFLSRSRTDAVPWGSADETDPLCIMYTSGTTGEPKGVVVSHRQRVLTVLLWGAEFGCYGPGEVALAASPLYHGGGLTSTLAALHFGGACTLTDGFDPGLARGLFEDGRVSSFFGVPTHFVDLLGQAGASGPFPRLKALVSNAAPLRQGLREEIIEAFGPHVLFDVYGSTEGGPLTVLRPEEQLVHPTSAGRPFAGVELVTGEHPTESGQSSSPGVMWVRSPYLFSGYWKREDETARSNEEGWYRTGDIASIDDDGFVHLLDRESSCIISGGLNVYPGEVERVLAAHPLVLEAVVVGVPHPRWGDEVRAVVILRSIDSTPEATVDALLDFARERLASYKVPKVIDVVGLLPRSAVGKVDRRSVRDMVLRRPPTD